MEGNLNFQEAIDYGMTKLTAKEEGKQLGAGSVKTDSPVLPVDKLEKDTKMVDCGNCFEKHKSRNCPAWGYECSKCHKQTIWRAGRTASRPSSRQPGPYIAQEMAGGTTEAGETSVIKAEAATTVEAATTAGTTAGTMTGGTTAGRAHPKRCTYPPGEVG